MSDLRTNLIDKKKKPESFEKIYKDCENRIKSIKQKNDQLQKNTGTDQQQKIIQEIQHQKEYMEKIITDLKLRIQQLEHNYRDAESKLNIRNLKNEAQKQIDRNKVILREFINKSFYFVQKKRVTYYADEKRSSRKDKSIRGSQNSDDSNKYKKKQGQQKEIPQEIQIDYQIEKKILEQKAVMINKVQQNVTKLNDIIKDIGRLAQQQGQNIDNVGENIANADANVVEAGQQMEEANEIQKDNRKKIMWIVIIIVLIVALILVLVFVLRKRN